MNEQFVHIRRLCIYTDQPFQESGADLRRALTAQFRNIPILHNHTKEGFDYRSPRVRYVVQHKMAQLVAFGSGLEIVEKIYRQGTKLQVGNKIYTITGTELEDRIVPFGIGEALYTYHSSTLWIPLNENNHDKFQRAATDEKKKNLLATILTGNYLSLCKTLGIFVSGRILTSVQQYKVVQVKHITTNLLGMKVVFVSNMLLSEWVGLGKLVSKGFGLMGKLD